MMFAARLPRDTGMTLDTWQSQSRQACKFACFALDQSWRHGDDAGYVLLSDTGVALNMGQAKQASLHVCLLQVGYKEQRSLSSFSLSCYFCVCVLSCLVQRYLSQTWMACVVGAPPRDKLSSVVGLSLVKHRRMLSPSTFLSSYPSSLIGIYCRH